MDRCSEHKDRQLRDYFLNRLTPEEVEVFQFHLFHCETCRMNLERMRLLVHEGEEEVVSASDAEESNAKKRRLTFSVFTRAAAVAGLLIVLARGCYYFLYAPPSDGELQLEMNESPILHSGDSIKMEVDSTAVELNEKKNKDVE